MARSSASREQLTDEGREAGRSLVCLSLSYLQMVDCHNFTHFCVMSLKIIGEKKEKHSAKNRSLQNTSMDLKGAFFVILKNHSSVLVKKERSNQQSKEGGQPK